MPDMTYSASKESAEFIRFAALPPVSFTIWAMGPLVPTSMVITATTIAVEMK